MVHNYLKQRRKLSLELKKFLNKFLKIIIYNYHLIDYKTINTLLFWANDKTCVKIVIGTTYLFVYKIYKIGVENIKNLKNFYCIKKFGICIPNYINSNY